MSWAWLKRWLKHRGQKSRHKKLKMAENVPTHQRTATLSKPIELSPAVFVKDYGYIPLVMANAAYVIEKNIRTKGLFQIKGTASSVMTKLMTKPKNGKMKTINVHDTVEALKTFLVSLRDPLLPDHVFEALISIPRTDRSSQYVFVLREFRKCSPYNFAILHFVVTLLSKVSQHALHNGADVRTLAVVLVFDVIRPLIGETSGHKVYASDMMQRLPFLITVMETLIENPDIFKMAGAVSDELFSEVETDQRNKESISVAKEHSKAEPVKCLWNSDSTYLLPVGAEARQGSEIPKPLHPAYVIDVIQPSPQDPGEAPTIVNPCEAYACNLKDVVVQSNDNMQCSSALSSVLAVSSSVNNGRNLVTAAGSECSTSREGILKTSKLKSSPGKKPLRSSGPKKTVGTRRKKKRKYSSKKQFGSEVVEGKLSDSSPSSDLGRLLMQENISGWSEETYSTDDRNSIMTKTLRCPKVLAVKTLVPEKIEDFEDCENLAIQTMHSSQMSPAEQQSGTSNVEDPVISIPDDRETVNAAEHQVTKNVMSVNTDSYLLKVPRKALKCRRKGMLPLKTNPLRNFDINNRSQLNDVQCFSISPLSLQNKEPEHLERINKTSSFVTFSPSTEGQHEDNKRIISQTNLRDANAAGSNGHSDLDSRKPGHFTLPTTFEYSKGTRDSASLCNHPLCGGKHCALSRSPDSSARHSADSSVSGCSNTRHSDKVSVSGCINTRHSDKVSVTGCVDCTNYAQLCVSDNDAGQTPGKKTEKGTISPTNLGNEVRVRKKGSFIPSTPFKTHTPKDLQQIIIVKVINDSPRTLARSRIRRVPKKSSIGGQTGALPERSSIGSWLENIFMISITMFIVSLVLFHLSNSNHEEDWNE